MSQTLNRPDFMVAIADLARRVDRLERRLTPAPTTAAVASGGGVGDLVMFRHEQSVASSGIGGDLGFTGYTRIEFEPTDVGYSEATEQFWTVNGDHTISYTPGIYAVISVVGFNPPSGSTGKNVEWDSAGLPHYQTLTSDMAGVVDTIIFSSGVEVIVVRADEPVAFFGGQEFRVTHNLGSTVTIGGSMFVTKIGNL